MSTLPTAGGNNGSGVSPSLPITIGDVTGLGTALAKRVAVDQVQTFTAGEQKQGRDNIGAMTLLSYADVAAFPVTGAGQTIYQVTTGDDAGRKYQWNGAAYVDFVVATGPLSVFGPNSYSAQGNEVVTAKDLRVNATGGMRFPGVLKSGTTTTIAGDFAISQVIRNYDGTQAAFAYLATSDTVPFSTDKFGFEVISGSVYAAKYAAGGSGVGYAAYLLATCAALTGGVHTIEFGVEAGVVYTRWKGVKTVHASPTISSGSVPSPVAPSPAYILHGNTNWPTQHDVILSRITNFIPTSDEAEGAAKGESRGRLAYRANNYVYGGPWADVNGGVSSATSATGATIVGVTQYAGSYWGTADAITVKVGDVVRLRGNNAATTGGVAVNLYGSTSLTAGEILLPVGAFDVTFTVTVAGTGRLYFIAATSDGIDATLSNLDAKVEGTVASYAPENCTSLNRWLDASGNNYHLLPVGGAKALNPQVPQRRSIRLDADMLTDTYTFSEPGWVAAPSGTGILEITRPSYAATEVNASVALLAAGTWDFDPDGGVSNFITFRDTTWTAADAVGLVELFWKE